MKHIQCVVIGSCTHEKSTLLDTYTSNLSPDEYTPTVFDNSIHLMAEDQAINLKLWDPPNQENYKPLNQFFFRMTDVFIVCFSLISPTSLELVETMWVPEIQQHCPGAPYVLVGLQSELRDEFAEHVEEYKSNGWDPVPTEQGEAMKRKINAAAYIECSCKKFFNVKEVFETAVAAVLHLQSPVEEKKFSPVEEKKKKKKFSLFSKSKSKSEFKEVEPDSTKISELQQQISELQQKLDQHKQHEIELQQKLEQEKQQHELELQEKLDQEKQRHELLFKQKLTLKKQQHKIELQEKIDQVKRQHESELKRQREEYEQKMLELNQMKQNKSTKQKQKSSANELKLLDEEEMNNYLPIEELGSGGGGKVFKVYAPPFFAIKEMNIQNANASTLKSFMNEYEIMNSLDHPNIIKTYGIHLSSTTIPPSIVLEFCPSNLVNEIEHGSLTNDTIILYIYQIAEGLKFIHSKNIIHRDIKPSNILISEEGLIKIADFGISKVMSVEEQTMTCEIGTRHYMAPEVLDSAEYTEKADVYSFGVVLYYILTGGQLPNIKFSDLFRRVKPTLPSSLTDFAKSLITKCIDYDSNERPSFEMILDELEQNQYNLVPLNERQISKVREFIQEHKDKIESC